MEKRVDAGYDADHTAVCWGDSVANMPDLGLC
jgi:hypothetical protein